MNPFPNLRSVGRPQVLVVGERVPREHAAGADGAEEQRAEDGLVRIAADPEPETVQGGPTEFCPEN